MDKNAPELSKAEYDILRILWRQGNLTVREVHDSLKDTRKWAYSTTKTMMDRMVRKKYLERRPFHRIYLYKSLISKPQGIMRWVEFFADRVLEMDISSTVALFGKTNSLNSEEIEELTSLLETSRNNKDKDH